MMICDGFVAVVVVNSPPFFVSFNLIFVSFSGTSLTAHKYLTDKLALENYCCVYCCKI